MIICRLSNARTLGMTCGFETTAKSEDELMKKIAEHAAKVHGMKTVPPDTLAAIKKAIKP